MLLVLTTTIGFSQNSKTSELKSPTVFLGYEHGSYFSRHHQVVDYFKMLESNGAGMVQLDEYGKTNENRELLLAYISTTENIQNLDKIKEAHAKGEIENVAIVWMSYNVHGNESSATEAAMKTAYELLTQHSDWLKDVVVIIDPCVNPDGRDRYVNWYNQKKNTNYNSNANSAEHNEDWPSGRFNHYLFDLNRDWAWLTQVESQQRIAVYNDWLPHVHVDFHEQGIDEPYYFAPAAEPIHEVISEWQKQFQTGLGRNHANYFDAKGWLYFTKEIFDLLYPSYGDTYPTFNGAIGMTYEQGGGEKAGLGVITGEGTELSLIDRIDHHHTTGISTVEFSVKNKQKLISEFNSFMTNHDYKYKMYALSGDVDKIRSLVHLLDAQQIEYSFGNGKTMKGFDYATSTSSSITTTENHLLVSVHQKKGAMVKALFEPKTALSDSLTYDITAWSLPFVFGLNCIASETDFKGTSKKLAFEESLVANDVYAYLIPWNSMADAKVLTALIGAEVKVRFTHEPFSFGKKIYPAGTLIILASENENKNLGGLIAETCRNNSIKFETTTTGMVDSGKDFGSGTVSLIKAPKIGILSGEGFDPLAVGEIWHYFEQELKYAITVFNLKDISAESLNEIDVFIIPEGWSELLDQNVSEWIKNGGKIIAVGGAVKQFGASEDYNLTPKDEIKPTKKEEYANAHVAHSEKERKEISDDIKGAIYKCKVDPTNPLAFGYSDNYFTLKLTPAAYNWLPEGDNVVYLEENPVPVAGFAGARAMKLQGTSVVFGVEYKGSGSIIYLVDNPLFRGFWENGKLFMANAVFFVNN